VTGTTIKAPEPSFTELVEGIVSDAQTLLEQQLTLLRCEIRDEIESTKDAAVSVGAGVGLVSVAGLLSTQMLAHLVHDTTGLPLWACYGLVGAAFGVAGLGQLERARRDARSLSLIPRQTTAELRENLAWLKQQTVPG
jgi:hypothetical protein